ncbi:MAG: chitobiase/beta-hexosaminidase C-terminal domain-containing protein [Cyclobacteriaceae bacterium]|nr:chitobiase/beta-hexosaminidase C-terminal domain-containing protein [Cyclobacteriaceae bacterium]
MRRSSAFILNVIFFFQVLLLFLFYFEDRLSLPPWLQVAGRLHPAMMHLPIAGLIFAFVLPWVGSRFKKKAYNKITLTVLSLTSLTAAFTALMGIFLAAQGDYGTEALAQHKNSGIILSILSYLLVLAFVYGRKSRVVYNSVMLFTVGTLLFTGHTGSVLTHGENFVLAPLKKSVATPPADASAYDQVIYPILEKKCTSCHNSSKAKGKLVMTSLAEFTKGGKQGKEWVAGKPSESRMIQYIHLPLSDDDHMPPDGKPQLTRPEIKLLEYWIASGADVEKKLTDFAETDSFRILGAAALAMTKTTVREEKTYSFSAASEETIRKMNTPFRSVFPLYQGSPALQADFFVRGSFQASALEELLEVKEQLVILNLSKMPVTDNDLKVIGNFVNLENINLNFSALDGSGLASLQSLKNLSSLSLAGTSVTGQRLAPVLAMPSMRELYVWNTKITEDEKAKLAAAHPGIRIFTTPFTDDQMLKLGKPILVNEGVLKKGDAVALRHPMPGVTIRYTLDGTAPDSVSSNRYDKPIPLTATATLRAIACRDGWYCSEVLETICFVEGHQPLRAQLLTKPDKQYPGEGDKSLADGRKGFIEDFKEPSWLGYKDGPFSAAFEFAGDSPAVQSIVISYGKNIGSYIFPPETVEVWAGKNSRDARLIQTVKISQPTTYESPQMSALVIPLKSTPPYTYYKVIAKPVAKLPAWHSGKGQKGWVFVDEVFFY